MVVLAEDGEMLVQTGRDLRVEYLAHDLQVIYSPLPDFGAPGDGQIASALDEALAAARGRSEPGNPLPRWDRSHRGVCRLPCPQGVRHGWNAGNRLGSPVHPRRRGEPGTEGYMCSHFVNSWTRSDGVSRPSDWQRRYGGKLWFRSDLVSGCTQIQMTSITT